MSESTNDRRYRRCICAVALFSASASSLSSVVVPLWLVVIDTPPILIGLVLGARHFPSLFLAIHGGSLFDRFDPRTVLMSFALVATVSLLCYPALPWVAPLLLLQMLTGFSENMGWIGAQTVIGQRMKGSASHTGHLTFWSRVGSFGGPPVAGAVWDLAGPWGAFPFLALWASGTILAAWLLPRQESEPETAPSGKSTLRAILPRLEDYTATFRLVAIPAVAFIVIVSVLRVVRNGIEQSFYIVYLEDFGLSATLIGTLLSVANISGAMGALLAGPAARRFKMHWFVLAVMATSLTAMTMTPLLPNYAALLVAAVILGGAIGVGQPLMIAMMSKAVDSQSQGKAVGLRTTANRFSSAIIPIVMGALVEVVGLGNSFLVLGGATLVLFIPVAFWARRIPAFNEPDEPRSPA